MERRSILVACCAAITVATPFALARLDARPLERLDAPRSADSPPAPAMKTASAPAAPRPPSALPAAASRSTSAPGLVVPDFKGKRLSVARRQARKLGLLIRTHEGGNPDDAIDSDLATFYRVRRQAIPAGSAVAQGTVVDVDLREIHDVATGY